MIPGAFAAKARCRVMQGVLYLTVYDMSSKATEMHDAWTSDPSHTVIKSPKPLPKLQLIQYDTNPALHGAALAV